MKQVTFELAKILYDYGFPQADLDVGYVISNDILYVNTDLADCIYEAQDNIVGLLMKDVPSKYRKPGHTFKTISAPTYMEVWLWMSDDRRILTVDYSTNIRRWNVHNYMDNSIYGQGATVEEALIEAIEKYWYIKTH